MKKHTAIHVLGGSSLRAAQALGCSKQRVSQWPVDEQGNLTSKHVVNEVLAALVRQNYEHFKGTPDAQPLDLDETTLHDLMHVPVTTE